MNVLIQAKTCVRCGALFTPFRPTQTRCSRACYHAVRAAARRGHEPPPRIDGAEWIELGAGAFTLVDAQDAPILRQHTWWRDARGYAGTKINGSRVLLHQLLLPCACVDHINRNSLDNRRANLRAVTPAQNSLNRSIGRNNTSGYKGVSRYGTKWGARIHVDGKRVWLGVFDTPEEAGAAYDRAVIAAGGEYAAPNSMLRGEAALQ